MATFEVSMYISLAQKSGQARLSLPMAEIRWLQELPNQLWKVVRIKEQGVKKNGDNFVPFESPKFNRINLNIQSPVPSYSCVWPPREGVTLPVLQPHITGLDWQKWELQAITADPASLHTSRCQLMDSFSFQKSGNLNTCFLLIKAIIEMY